MNHKKKYDNSVRLASVTEKQWCEALDELTAYLTWRLRGKTARGEMFKSRAIYSFIFQSSVLSIHSARRRAANLPKERHML